MMGGARKAEALPAGVRGIEEEEKEEEEGGLG